MNAPPSRRWARWGLLVTTVILGAVLVTAVVVAYLAARDASQSVTSAQAIDLIFTVRRTLRFAEDMESAAKDLLEAGRERGVRYVAVVDPAGRAVISAGKPSRARRPLPSAPRGHAPVIHRVGGRIQVVAPWAPGRGMGMRWRWGWRRPGGRGMGPPHRHRHGAGFWRNRLVVEFEPRVADTLVGNARGTLIIGLVAAGALLAAAVVFWRLTRRADEIEQALARERQLAALGEMSAVLGHELRNPLASLKGHAQLLLEKLPPDHPALRGAQTVVREAMRLEEMTGQVLDFARTGTVERVPVDPVAVARAAVDASGSERVELILEEPPATWHLDRARIEQVLVNLLRNAEEASPSGANVQLRVAREGDELVYAVRDHGPGIEPGEEERIFEPFYTRRVKGTGLGLTVAQRIVQRHGGSLRATNHPEGGAVFRIAVPGRRES